MALPSNTKRKIFDGRYEIISIVGRGADSVVYHARHVSGSAQEVALKVLVNRKGRSPLSDRLRKEALTLVSCRHKYVVRLDDFHSIDDLCYLSMEFAPLGDLAKYAQSRSSRISVEQAHIFLTQALEALDFVHATGVIHRDLKPENILVVSEREIRLADFGIAILPGDELNADDLKNGVGTLDYLAPEVLEGIRYDSRSDLYSLGVLFYELLAGKHPFNDAPIAEQLEVRRDNKVTPLNELMRDVPAHIAAVIATLMRFDADKRFQSASEAINALRNERFQLIEDSFSSGIPLQSAAHQSAPTANEGLTSSIASNATATIAPSTAPAKDTALAPFDVPANSDTPSNRPSQPTEKIDLERIKAIIAKDTQSRAVVAQADVASPSEQAKEFEVDPSLSARRGKINSHQKSDSSRPSIAISFKQAIHAFSNFPIHVRLLGVAAISAIITIAALFTLPLIIPKSSVNSASMEGHHAATTAASEDPSTSSKQNPSPKAATFVSSLDEGIYSGTLEGLIPNTDTPLLLVSIPKAHRLILILGVDGWIPAEASTVAEDGTPIENPTFRSNGLILRFNGELSSGEIIGTFTDVLSGESGVWNVRQSS